MAKDRDISIEQSLPIVDINGLNTNKDTYLGGTVEIVGAATFAGVAASGNATVGGTLAVTGATDIQGALTVNGAATVTGAISSVSTLTAKNASAITATGALAVSWSSTATLGIYYGSGVPTIAAATGSLGIRTDGSGATNRFFIASGGTGWTAVTTQA